ncbi:MAG: hypothetical protein JWM80_3733 [Cyanobacteria bacterium RYN_339]|nr:hypothetical protein [Cyanobacteria bacterium RYN_339]
MKNVLRNALLASAFVALAGCTGGIPGLPSTTTPGTTPGTTPVGTTPTNNTTTTTPTTTTTATCQTNYSATPDTGASYLGAYSGKKLPAGYNNAYSSEDQVTARITQAKSDGSWTVYQCNYADAVAVWRSKGNS